MTVWGYGVYYGINSKYQNFTVAAMLGDIAVSVQGLKCHILSFWIILVTISGEGACHVGLFSIPYQHTVSWLELHLYRAFLDTQRALNTDNKFVQAKRVQVAEGKKNTKCESSLRIQL